MVVATSVVGGDLFKCNPRSQANSTARQFLPLQQGELSSDLLEYANDGIGRVVAKAIRGPIRAREFRLAAKKIKMIGHHVQDCGLDHGLKLDEQSISERGMAAANQSEVLVKFLQRYDAGITTSDVVLLQQPPQATTQTLLRRLQANGLGSFFFDAADCLKQAMRVNKSSTKSTPTLIDNAADEGAPRLERLTWRPSSGESSKRELDLTAGQNIRKVLRSDLDCVYLSCLVGSLVGSCKSFAGSNDLMAVSIGMVGYLSQRILREIRGHSDQLVGAKRHSESVT
jgi:hypothetical protein